LNSFEKELFIHQALIKKFHENIKNILRNFCKALDKVFPQNGVGIALKHGKLYKIEYCEKLKYKKEEIESILNGHKFINKKNKTINRVKNFNLNFIPDKALKLIIITGSKSHSNIQHTSLLNIADYLSNIIDIKKNEISRTKENIKYHSIFKKSPAFTLLVDNAGNVMEWNETGEKKFGYSLKKGPIHFTQFINEDNIDSTTKIFKEIFIEAENIKKKHKFHQNKKNRKIKEKCLSEITELCTTNATAKFHNKNNSIEYDIEFNVNLIIDDENLDLMGYIVTAIDVTEKNLYRKRLKESEEKYAELFKLSPNFAIILDTSGRVIEFNYKSVETFGFNFTDKSTYKDFVVKEDHEKAINLFIELYKMARGVKNKWKKEKSVTKNECLAELRKLEVRDAPIKLKNAKGKIYDAEFYANLWISEFDLDIKGALISANDVTERNLYRNMVVVSEKKYRELVEEKTRDIIFSLDADARFTTVNKNIGEKLGYTEKYLKDKKITDILYDDPFDKTNINKEIFTENLNNVLKDKLKDVRFNAVCNHKFLGEPITLQFKLDPIYKNKKVIGIMGFASDITDDPLREYMHEESLCYEIENRLTTAEEISYKLTINLQKYFKKSKVGLIRLGLRELIVNAIEHGNLEITYDEKTEALEDHKYQKLLKERQNSEKFRNRRIKIKYNLTDKFVKYSIIDQGAGFNYNEVLEKNIAEINEQMSQHGRGIVIAQSIFDEIEFNEKGNVVSTTIYIEKSNL